MTAFLGMRGTADFVTDQRPKNWREGIFLLQINGTAPLTALLALAKERELDDPEFNWWTKKTPTQDATITGVYTDAALLTAYISGATAGTTLYFKMSAADVAHFRVGHEVLARVTSDLTVDVVGKVTAKVANGASSYVAVYLLENDDNSGTKDLSDCNYLMVIGNGNAEGAETPDAISYDPVKYFNYSQIFRTPLSITRTARKTRLRTGDAYKEAKREALEIHSIEMEKAFWLGEKKEITGSNSKPERYTQGIFKFARENVPANYRDFTVDYVGNTWVSKGDEWLDTYLEVLFRYATDVIAYCGSGALLGLQRLMKATGTIYLEPGQDFGLGIKVTKLVTSFGEIPLKTHPLFSQNPTLRNTIAIIEPKQLVYSYIDDTQFIAQGDKLGRSSSGKRIDGTLEEFLTEAGLEYHHPDTILILNNVGIDG